MWGNINQQFESKNIEETRNCSIEGKKLNVLMSKKCKKVCMALNYSGH